MHLNRTPPLYVGGSYDDGERPVAEVRLLRLKGGSVAVRLEWTDATLNRSPGARRYPDAGAKGIYKKHSEGIEKFGDAACVMLPVKGGRRSVFPSIMMGDKADPVFLYFWRAGAGAQLLKATGRETPRATGEAIAVRAGRTAKGWFVSFLVKDLPSGTPIAFAI